MNADLYRNPYTARWASSVGWPEVDYLRERWATAARQPPTDSMEAIIRKGGATLSGVSNVAAGEGFDVHVLAMSGLLEPISRHADSRDYGRTVYGLTPKGRAHQERLRIADLASIGVYEVRV